jgi:hypothetical protein
MHIGFWDYTCPKHGSLERYTLDDCDRLLDDMAAGGWDSFVLGVKWLTTGYRSRYNWLDQNPECTAISSDNAIVHRLLGGAKARGMKVWILVVASIFSVKEFGFNPPHMMGGSNEGEAAYDLDDPRVLERACLVSAECAELFGSHADGIIVEIEFCDTEAPHRIPIYEAWAKENNAPPYEKIKQMMLQPRSYPMWHWRAFTTHRRIVACKEIDKAIRATGFKGKLAGIVEMDNGPGFVLRASNLPEIKAGLPDWALVTYDSIYDRRVNRLSTCELVVKEPKEMGFEVGWVTRGVMTFPLQSWVSQDTLQNQWRMSLEDARDYRPDHLWFMGADARLDGWVCSNTKLPLWGESDPASARKKLIEMSREILKED